MNHLSRLGVERRSRKTWNFFVVFFGLLYSLYISFTVAGKYIPNYDSGGILYAMVLGIATGIVVGFVVCGSWGSFLLGSIIFPLSAITNAVFTTITVAAIYPNGLPEWFSLATSHPSGLFEWFSLITSLIPGTWVGTYLLCRFCSE